MAEEKFLSEIKTNENSALKLEVPETTSPMFKGYVRGMCERLYKKSFEHSSAYGTYFVLDSMVRNGERVYIVALDKKFRPIEKWLATIGLLFSDGAFSKIDEFAAECGAKYIIVAKKGRNGGFESELDFADRIYKSLKSAKLYDYLTVDEDGYRSYMERLR